ncbi:hypothetical protein XM79_c11507 [Vibrio vulnificus]|nr:hypothetical protein XM78_c11532 [Vibrio vulnificus]OQK66846.1 hypothetical protein XM79_c11507 [Vibrio vulnificus]
MEVKTLSKILLPYAQIAIESCILASKANALLRGEQCTTKATAHRLNHETRRILKMPRIANPA